MKEKFAFIVACMLAISAFPSMPSAFQDEETDIPTWNIGDAWVYQVRNITYISENISFEGDIDELTIWVDEIWFQNHTYILKIEGDIEGNITIYWITGHLIGNITGKMEVRMTDLATLYQWTNASGIIEVGPIDLDFYSNSTTTYDIPPEGYDFPIVNGEEWQVISNGSTSGYYYVEWIGRINFSSNISGCEEAECISYENVSTPAGVFASFHLFNENNGTRHAWYAPDVKNIVKTDINYTTENTTLVANASLISYSLIEQELNLSLNIYPPTAHVGEEINISGYLFDENGDAIQNATINIEIPYVSKEWNVTTDENGYYELIIPAPLIRDNTPSNDTGSDGVLSIYNNDNYIVRTLVIDDDPPIILTMDRNPKGMIEPGDWINITCEVSDDFCINEVRINITDPKGMHENESMQMLRGDETNALYYYNTTYEHAGVYEFYIWVNDSAMNWVKSETQTIFIFGTDVLPPGIRDVVIIPDEQTSGGYVNISCLAYDDIGLKQVRIIITYPNGSYINESMNFLHGYRWRAYFYYNNTYSIPGMYNVVIWAIDGNDNQAIATGYKFIIT